MLYMSGGGVQIFSMGIVAMLLLSPFKNLSSMNEGALQFFFFVSCFVLFVALALLLSGPPVSPHPFPHSFPPLFFLSFADWIYSTLPFSPRVSVLPCVCVLMMRRHAQNVGYDFFLKMNNSLCAFCAWSVIVVPHSQITLHSPAAKDRLPSVQHPHTRTWSLEMSVHGVTPDGHWRLASVRESWVRAGDFVVLETGFRSRRLVVLYSEFTYWVCD